jgi:hypothetical protein
VHMGERSAVPCRAKSRSGGIDDRDWRETLPGDLSRYDSLIERPPYPSDDTFPSAPSTSPQSHLHYASR